MAIFFGMQDEDAVALAGVLSTATLAIVTLILGALRERRQQLTAVDRDRARRTLVPRTQQQLACTFHGPQGGYWLAEIALTVHNVGETRRNFSRIRLRLRGIEANAVPRTWRGSARINFDLPVATIELIEPDHYYYVDTGVTQTFTASVPVPVSVSFLLVHALLTVATSDELADQPTAAQPRYDRDLTEERLFTVASAADATAALPPR